MNQFDAIIMSLGIDKQHEQCVRRTVGLNGFRSTGQRFPLTSLLNKVIARIDREESRTMSQSSAATSRRSRRRSHATRRLRPSDLG